MYGYSSVFECYAGALKKTSGRRALGVHLLKCLLQGIVVFFCFILPFLSTCWIVTLFGADKKVHEVTVLCIKLMCFRPLLIYFRDLLIKYLVIQEYAYVCLALTAVCVPLSVVMDWLAVVRLRWGIYGLGSAQYATVCLSLIFLVIFIAWKRKELEFPDLHDLGMDELLRGWTEMFKLGIYSGLRTFASFAMYAIATVVCQSSGSNTAAANVVIAISTLMLNASVYGGAYAQALIIGEALGKGNKEDVKFAIKLGMLNLLVDRIMIITLFLVSIKPITQLLSYNDDVIEEVLQANGSVICMFLLFGLDEYLSRGILVPFAQQAIVAMVTPASIYLVAVPLLITMVRVYHVPVYGVILCESSSYVVQCLVYVIRLCTCDVTEEIERCRERNALTEGFKRRDELGGMQPSPSPAMVNNFDGITSDDQTSNGPGEGRVTQDNDPSNFTQIEQHKE